MTTATPLTIRPSQLQRVQHCPGSVVMERANPQGDSDDRREGVAAAWAFAEQLAGRVVAEGQIAPNGIVLNVEMLEAADVGTDYVRAKTAGAMGSLMIETPVFPKRIYGPMTGRLDVGAWLFPASRRPHLFVAEYKYGHKFVDAYENAQLIAYVAALLDTTKYDDQIVDVTLAVIQPRCFAASSPVREWNVTAAELRGHINRLAMACEEAAGPSPVCHPNPECVTCEGRVLCQAYQRDAFRSMEYSASAVPFDLTPEAAGLELRWLQQCESRLKGRITGLEAQIEAQLKNGRRVPWWRLESTKGREVWRNPAEAIEMGEMMGVNVAKPVEPVTPAQARKLGLSDEIMAEYAHRPAGGLRVVADEGGTSLARVFGSSRSVD
jgi:hypothetical protein